jgi:TPR repeat protein
MNARFPSFLRFTVLGLAGSLGAVFLLAEPPSPELLRRADAGDAAAAVEAAGAYIESKTEADYVRAAAYIDKALAANPSVPNAQAILALLLHQGRGVPMDRPRARAMIEAGAAAGDPAMRELATELKKRGHLNSLLRLAAPEPELLAKAEEGDAAAQWQLAEAYRNGWIDYPKGNFPAPAWTERAAQGGSAEAQYFMSEGFGSGAYGYPKDFARQRLWLERAATQKYPRALRRLAELLAEGKNGFPKDEKKALGLAREALAAGFKDAEGIAGALLLKLAANDTERSEAANLLASAESRGDIAARRVLSSEIANARMGGGEPKQLRRILDQGVQDGDWRAKTRLGLLLLEGKSLPKEEGRAVSLLQEVADKQLVPIAAEALMNFHRTRLETIGKQHAGGNSPEVRAAYVEYREAVLLLGLAASGEFRMQAVQHLTEFKSLEQMMGGQKQISTPHLLVESVALMRIYRSEGGRNPAGLAWLEKIEGELRQQTAKNGYGKTMVQQVAERESAFRERLRSRPDFAD